MGIQIRRSVVRDRTFVWNVVWQIRKKEKQLCLNVFKKEREGEARENLYVGNKIQTGR